MKSEENINLEVTQDGLRFAGIYSLKIVDKNARKRVFASLVILNSLANFFRKQNLNVLNTKNIYKASKLCEEFEITDLYVNNWRIDVRLAMPGDYFYIPKTHYDNEILPDFYVVATIDKELKKPQFIGYVAPKDLHTTPFSSNYYKANFDDLKDMSNMLNELKQEKEPNYNEKDHRFFYTKILSYFDNETDNFTKSKLLNHLFHCQNCRSELINFCGFDIIAQKVENFADLFDDESLNIIGALKAQDDEDYEDSDYLPEEEEEEENIQNENEKNESNINDETFTNDSDVFSQDIPTLEENKEEKEIAKKEEENKTNQEKQENNNKEKPEEQQQQTLTFTESDTTSTEKEKVSIAESLLDIPDEIFNNEYDEEKHSKMNKKRAWHQNASKKEQVIVDYDEFGQPIYNENSPEDYKIIEDETGNKGSDIIIEGSTETLNEDLITTVPAQQKPKKVPLSLLLIIFGALLIIIVACTIFFRPSDDTTETDTPIIPEPSTVNSSNIDNIIAKNINSKTGLIKIQNINWVTQKSLLNDDNFKEYLKQVDKRFKTKIKLNSNSITKAPDNNKIIAEIIVTPDGKIKSSRIAETSGIQELDNIIKESLEEAMNNVPVREQAEDEQQPDEYYIKVMIEMAKP